LFAINQLCGTDICFSLIDIKYVPLSYIHIQYEVTPRPSDVKLNGNNYWNTKNKAACPQAWTWK